MREIITFEPPREYAPSNIAFWEPISKELKQEGSKQSTTLISKAKKFLENNCVRQLSATKWECLPIFRYNKTTYKIRLTIDGWECNCQGFNKKLREFQEGHSDIQPICSHILAVIQNKFIEEKNEN